MPSFRAPLAVLVPALLACFSVQARTQNTIHIPADRPTIQAGINAAQNGDTVLIAPGTYYENIDFKGKAITLTSSDGAAKTILDGGGIGTTVTFKSGETRAAVLSNLTVTHGGTTSQYQYSGDGVSITNSQPTLLNNVITQNYCQNIGIYASAPLIQGNVISSSLNPEHCFVSETGGIYVDGNLQSSSPAGGDGTPALILGNTIENNTTGQGGDGGGDGGAGIAIWGGSPLIEGNILRNNTTRSGSGGAINIVYGTSISIIQNLIYGNSAGCGGGAIGSEMGGLSGDIYLLIANNTIVGNTGGVGGGYSDCRKSSEIWTAFYNGGGPTIKFVNNIFEANASPALDCGMLNSSPDEGHQSLFDHNLLYDSAGTFFASNCLDTSRLHGNLVADPQFANLAGNDFHLRVTSPAIDAGNGSVLAMLKMLSNVDLSKDFDGNAREQDVTGKGLPVIDMGAYEFSGAVDSTPTRVVLSSSAYSGSASTTNTLTATLSSALGTPSGTVNFFMDNKSIGSAPITAGVATLKNVAYTPGVHVLYASYDGGGGFQPAISVIIIVDLDKYATAISLTASPNVSLVGQTVKFSVHTSSADSTYIPTPIQLSDSSTNTPLATLLPDPSGNASFSTSTLGLGTHDITASYAGDTLHAAYAVSDFQQVVGGYATTTSVSSSVNPSNINQSVTFSAHVTSSNGTPTGSVQFTDGTSNILGSSPLDASGNASVSTSTLAAGSHTITATYTPTGAFAASSGFVIQQVNGLSAKAVLTANPATIQAGDTVTLTATVTGTAGGTTPTGSVTFYDGSTVLGTSTLSTAGVASINNSSLYTGGNTLSCTYSGDAAYSTTNCPAIQYSVQAADTTTTLVPSLNPAPALTPVTFTATLTSRGQPNSSGTHFYLDGALLRGGTAGPGGTTSIQLTLAAGVHTVTAEFAGDVGFNGSFATVTETVLANPTVTTLSLPQGTVYQNQSLSLTSTVKPLTGTAQPYGTVTLLEGTTPLASQTIAASQNNPLVFFSLAPLTPGTHVLTAVYMPADGNFVTSSAQLTIVVAAQTFTFAESTPAITIQTEHHASMSVTLTSVGGWTGPVQLGCAAPLPPVLSCEITPSMTLAPNASVTTKLTLDTDAVLDFKSDLNRSSAPFLHGAAPVATLAVLLLPLACFRRRRRLPLLAWSFVLLGALTALTGCSSKYPDHTPPGTYNITLTATGTGAGATAPTTQTLQLTLIVTP